MGLLVVASCTDGGPTSGPQSGAEPTRPNVLLFTIDTVRADHVGAYGYEKPTTPRLDELARRSLLFRDNLSQSGSTLSSVPSFLTGRFPHSDRLLEKDGALRSEVPTLPEALRAGGWTTMAVLANRYAGCGFGTCRGFDYADDEHIRPEKAARTLDRAERMLEAHGSPPWFLWVHLRQPHMPYDPEEEVFARFYPAKPGEPTLFSILDRPLLGLRPSEALSRHFRRRGESDRKYRFAKHEERMTPSVLAQTRAMYDGALWEADRALGRMLDEVEARGETGHTVVAVASDHGENLGEHGWIAHNELHEEVTRTPLVIHLPGVAPRRVEAPTMNVDLMPTLLTAVGVEVPGPVRGTDLSAPDLGDRPQYAEYSNRYSVRHRGWKLVGRRSRRGRWHQKLYRIEVDPAERFDRFHAQPRVARRMMSLARGIRERRLGASVDAPDAPVLDRLRALGYVK